MTIHAAAATIIAQDDRARRRVEVLRGLINTALATNNPRALRLVLDEALTLAESGLLNDFERDRWVKALETP